ncbi:SMR family transporter [Demequina sp. NBRC 110053]|uniref:SMR family transporter n=1 Tax=Demequina sp. NBRC 110053 TaxID=1570342 RepID=UPI0009FF944F|nr:SMR family transporter [Demequina sp. NBRC 110053]
MGLGAGVWATLLAGVALNAGAQLLLKAGTTALGETLFRADAVLGSVARIVFQPLILTGLVCYVVSFGLWIAVLSKAPFSVAYPMLSLGFVANALVAAAVFGEPLTVMKVAGIGLIVVGVFVLSRASAP